MLSKSEDILLEKEIQGIKFSLYGKIILLTLVTVGAFFFAHTLVELFSIVGITIGLNIVLYILSKFLKKGKYIQFVGLFCVALDLAIITILPFIWYNSAGGETTIPRTYLIKTYIHFLIAGTLIMNAFSLQPIYPLLYALGVVISQAGLLIYAQADPRFLTTENFHHAVLGEAVHLNNYILSMAIIGLLGFFMAYLTFRVRRTVLLAVSNELKLNQLYRYFSPNVVEDVKKRENDLFLSDVKEMKVAVMFCDINGFTALSESIGPEKTMELLSSYHSFVLESVFECKGTLDKCVGDGMLITFGTPFPTGADGENALVAGLSILEKLTSFNQNRESKGEKPIQVRLGVHYGNVLVGNLGLDSNFEYTVIGEAVTVASRLEVLAREMKKSFLVSKELLTQVTDLHSLGVKASSHGNVSLKTKTKSTEIFSIERKI